MYVHMSVCMFVCMHRFSRCCVEEFLNLFFCLGAKIQPWTLDGIRRCYVVGLGEGKRGRLGISLEVETDKETE